MGPDHKDLMSYCEPGWVSDYHFTNALRFRRFDGALPLVAVLAAEAESLLLWGGLDGEGEPFLSPAFVVDAPSALPDSTGAHRVTGQTASGGELFSLNFAMPEVADGGRELILRFRSPGSAWLGRQTWRASRSQGPVGRLRWTVTPIFPWPSFSIRAMDR